MSTETKKYHRTAKFPVHDPSGRKLRRLKKMQQRYSSAYAKVLWSLKGLEDETLEKFASANPSSVAEYIKETLGEQPLEGAMWSGLIEDIQQSIGTYLETPGANFPAPAGQSSKSVKELREALLEATTKEEEDLLKAELKRKDETYTRPIQFVRYRDNPIIRSDDGEKLWVAPHLQEREDGKTGALPPNGSCIRNKFTYSTSTHHWRTQSNKETLPIEISRWHMHRFFRNGTPTSSKVEVTEEGEIYIHYAFKFEVDVEYDAKTGPMLGVDRGRSITAAYSVVNRDGEVLEQGSSASEKLRDKLREIDRQISETQENGENPSPYWDKRRNVVQDALHRIANRIVETAKRHGASICFEDLENLSGGKNLNRRQYSRLMEYVQYKAEAKGIWVLEVHPAYTSRTCPHCGHHDADNRGGQKHTSLSRDEFECQRCGYEAHSDLNAARLIALRGMFNSEGGREKTGCDTLMELAKNRSPARKKDRREHSSDQFATESALS